MEESALPAGTRRETFRYFTSKSRSQLLFVRDGVSRKASFESWRGNSISGWQAEWNQRILVAPRCGFELAEFSGSGEELPCR